MPPAIGPYPRALDLSRLKTSAFLLGPRMTGKTTLLHSLTCRLFIDLLDPETELSYRRQPGLFWEELTALPPASVVIVDEVQKVPALLDYVQMGIDQLGHRFILSGSSARKLKRGGANLLGGRAVMKRLHPLSHTELDRDFSLGNALVYGTLPHICVRLRQKDLDEIRSLLRGYVTLYIKEEIQAEAVTRRLDAFQRFLPVAAQNNAQVIEYANVSRDCAVPMSTVKEYYQILADTLLGEFLWPHDRSERKKARPKFYFFDCGVTRALQNRLTDPPTPVEDGFLFETWFFRELTRLRDAREAEHEFTLWREGIHEIDFLVMRSGKPAMAFECKTGQRLPSAATLAAFRRRFPKTPVLIVSKTDVRERALEDGTRVVPWREALRLYEKLDSRRNVHAGSSDGSGESC